MAFNLTRSLCGRSLGRSLSHQLNGIRSPINPMVRTVSLKIVPPPEHEKLPYEEKNAFLKREMSPHLTIYKFQITSVLSITHRFTGMALSGYAAALGIGALVLPYDFAAFVTMVEGLHLSAASLAVIKFTLAYPAAFHTCNGVRHLFWDMGKFLKLKEVYSTGYLMLGVSFALAALLAAM
ncbi:succinate dehydrogenase cytochrome b560 subunit, mitochondrial-like [Bradysia coprophila]|uniref:succinate dehydrogenase cytochrome b560 subunit, mitochondrial-like n=1 Tax=Bradysia coprophila TaxID=38358 RepID=UPI00187DC762|nr:succinate dehydrogenase cytochrome b560 subunit, mitochondrial-like [Bradysia coprophila]